MIFDSTIAAGDREAADRTSHTDVGTYRPTTRSGQLCKRCFDIVATLLFLSFAILFAVPVIAAIGLEGGSPIYRHLRIGRGGRVFNCYKFRTMHIGAEASLQNLLAQNPALREEWNEGFKLRNDPRVTKLGRFLRKTSLDELPQIWNILKGEMSWVGPRPITSAELPKYGPHLPAYLACLPGITGLWQINGRSDTTYQDRIRFDAEYAARQSLLLDLKILLLTIPRVLAARGSR